MEFVLGAHIREETDELQRLTQLLKTKKDVFAIATQLRVGGNTTQMHHNQASHCV